MSKIVGKVYIIGTGPGDYRLMTLKAVECIGIADVIVYDRLGSNQIKRFARADAEFIFVGKMPDKHIVPQEEINKILVQKALEGKCVARVKGGDPFVFGRGGEEAEALVNEGISFEIIPGITSAISVPAYAGIPVTHRDICSSFHVITGHERPEKEESILDFEVLSKLTGTLVFLMGVKNLSEIANKLILHGKNAKTPVALIEKGTTFEQRVVTGTLDTIEAIAKEENVKSPAIIIIGEVVRFKDSLKWFPYGLLGGKRILVTRAREQASQLVSRIEELGGEAIEFPTIKITQPEDFEEFDGALERINEYSWVVFTSVNGVNAFFERMRLKKIDVRKLFNAKICAVGSSTAEALNRIGLMVDIIPEKYTTEALMELLQKHVSKGERVLLARADIANKELYKGLVNYGICADDLVVYRTEIDGENKNEIVQLLKDRGLDFITFTSSSTVTNFIQAIGSEYLELLKGVKIACIGPVTAKTATEQGLTIDSVADKYTIDGLVEKLYDNDIQNITID